MSDTAQNFNSNVNDIWSVPDSMQVSQTNGSAQNPHDDSNQPSPPKPLSGSFGKPGLAGGGESGGGSESGIIAQELLDKARLEEVGHIAEIYKSTETLASPEVGEKLKPAEAYKPKEEKTSVSQVAQPEETPLKGKIVDQRTGKVKTHRVAETADKTTKVADIKEQEFIEGAEQVHSII